MGETKIYVSVERPNGHLVIDGPLSLLRELLRALREPASKEKTQAPNGEQVAQPEKEASHAA